MECAIWSPGCGITALTAWCPARCGWHVRSSLSPSTASGRGAWLAGAGGATARPASTHVSIGESRGLAGGERDDERTPWPSTSWQILATGRHESGPSHAPRGPRTRPQRPDSCDFPPPAPRGGFSSWRRPPSPPPTVQGKMLPCTVFRGTSMRNYNSRPCQWLRGAAGQAPFVPIRDRRTYRMMPPLRK